MCALVALWLSFWAQLFKTNDVRLVQDSLKFQMSEIRQYVLLEKCEKFLLYFQQEISVYFIIHHITLRRPLDELVKLTML